jgi:beta-lactamase regulating signal transducer with metallopeptidase domain
MAALVAVLNSLARTWSVWMAHMSWQVAALVAVAWLATHAFRKASASFRYAIWLLVFVKLVLPPTLATPWSAGNFTARFLENPRTQAIRDELPTWQPYEAEVQPYPAASLGDASPQMAVPLAPRAPRLRPLALLMAGWSAVALALFAALAWQYRRYSRTVLGRLSPASERLQRILSRRIDAMHIRRAPRLMVSPSVQTPALFGIRRPIILIPEGQEDRLSEEELSAILSHELAHIKRNDVMMTTVAGLLSCAYWFHPAVWLANLFLRREREMACDDAVLQSTKREGKTYASTIARVAESFTGSIPAAAGFLGLLELSDNLLHRMRSVADSRRTRRLGWISVLAIVLVSVTCVPMGRWTRPAPEPANTATVDEEIALYYSKAHPEVQEFIRWTAQTFGRPGVGLWLPENAFDSLGRGEREAKVEYDAKVLEGEYGRHLCNAIVEAGVLRDKRLLPGVLKVATYHRDDRDYDCRAKWMAVAALGRLGDESVVPDLVNLVDHGNKNVRMWARASLVRLTGQNFADDKQAWARWWNGAGKEPKIDLAELKPWTPPAGVSAAKEGLASGQLALEKVKDGVHIKAFVDGKDTIKIRGDELWYEHHRWDLPGKWRDTLGNIDYDEPTYINGVAWKPEWQEGVSKPYHLVEVVLPREANDRINLTKIAGRGLVSITDTPKPENEYTLSVLFDDDMPFAGAAWYEAVIQWGPGDTPMESAKEPSSGSSLVTSTMTPPRIPAAAELPGTLIFQGQYIHRSRGSDGGTGSLWIKQQEDGSITAITQLPLMGATCVAVGDRSHSLKRFTVSREASGEQPGYLIVLDIQDGKLFLTQRGVRQDHDGTELRVPAGAVFDPNTPRVDPYCAANVLLRGLALRQGQAQEFQGYDWNNTFDAMEAYRAKIAHAGKEEITVPAGTFEANHLVLTQLTSADTWFKKRAGDVTDFWVLDNNVIVRILRHREPYELLLVDFKSPSPLPGLKERGAGVGVAEEITEPATPAAAAVQTAPEIVSVSPPIGASDVDPATKEIRVTFDQDMGGGFSWTGGGPVYPKMTGRPQWVDKRICVMPVELESGKFYRVGINSKSHKNFRGVNGIPARNRVIYFATEGAGPDELRALKPPTVVSMVPENGATNVPSTLTEMSVTFDQPMGGGFSWTGGGENFPEGTGAPQWSADKKTCARPVSLKPNWSYRVGLNSPSHINFMSAYGVPLEPVVWQFSTGE